MTRVSVTQSTGSPKLSLDVILAPFEARRAITPEDEVGKRREGFRFGWELNRLQGGSRSEAGARLEELFITGRISDAEYTKLAIELARCGLLTNEHPAADGR